MRSNSIKTDGRVPAGRLEPWGRFSPRTFFFLRAFVASGWLFSAAAGAGAQVPPAPSALTAVPSNGAVSLEWSAVPAATSYYLYRSLTSPTPTGTLPATDTPTPTPTGTLSPTATDTPVAVVPAPTQAYTDFQVTNGRGYLYQVAGEDSAGLGPAAGAAAAPFSPPQPVQPVAVQALRPDALDLSWGLPNSTYPVTAYWVYQFAETTPGGTPPPPPTWVPTSTPIASTASTSYTDGSASSAGTTYYYAVRARDNQGNLGMVPTLNTTPAAPQSTLPPGPPLLSAQVGLTLTPGVGTYATPAAAADGYGVRLLWNGAGASEGVTAYTIFRNQTPMATLAYSTPTPTLVFDDSSLPSASAASTVLNYSVSASNAVGGTSSNSVPETLTGTGIPGFLQVTPDATAAAVTLSWNPASAGTYGLAGYWLFKSSGAGAPTSTPPPTGSPTPTWTPTPTAFATLAATPSQTSTVIFTDAPVPDADRLRYWVVPFDATGHGQSATTAQAPYLNLAPTPVSNVQALAPAGNNAVTVTWSAGGAGFYGTPQDYVLYREDVLTQTPTPVATVPSSLTGATDYVVATPGTPVAYLVRARDGLGNLSDFSTPSAAVTTVPLTPPSAPVLLPVTGSANSVRFAWLLNPLPDAVDSYWVYGPDWTTVTPEATPVATLIPSPTMVWSVPATVWDASVGYLLAHNSQGFSLPATLAGIPVPSYAVTAVLTPGNRQVQVSWTLVPTPGSTPAIDSYGVYRSLTPGAAFTPVATVDLASPVYPDSAVGPGETYYYRITARGNGANGLLAESPLYPTTTPIPESGVGTWPNAPTGLTAISASATQVSLYWSGNAAQENVQSYEVLQDGTPIATVAANASPTATYGAAATQAASGLYAYQVVAENGQGPSDPSSTLNQLAPPVLTPTVELTPPVYVTPTPSTTPTITPIQPGVWVSGLTYTGAVGGYTLYRQNQPTPSVTGTPAFVPVGAASTGTPSIADNYPAAGFVNNYEVVANNGAGTSADPSVSAQFAVTLWPNAPAFGLTADASAVTLSWPTPAANDVPISLYDIYRGIYVATTPTVLPTPFATAQPPASDFVDSAVTPGNGYVYWMDAQNAGGASGLSAPQTIIPVQPPTLALTPLSSHNLLVWSPVTLTATPGLVSGYVVYRAQAMPSVTPTFLPYSPVLEGLSNTSYVDTGTSDGVSYLYEVAPSSSNNILGPFSNQVSVTVEPRPVTDLTAVSGDGVVQLRWGYQGVTTTTYVITRQLGTGADSSAQTLATGFQGVNYTDSGVLDKTFYVYRLYTVNAQGVTAQGYASAIALPAKPPILYSGNNIDARKVSLFQDQTGNILSWFPADTHNALYDLLDPTTMYPMGGYSVYKSVGGIGQGVLQELPGIVQAPAQGGGAPVSLSYTDPVQLVGGQSYTYLVQAFDSPPDLPATLTQAQAVTQGLVHATSYDYVTAYALTEGASLDRNAIRPYGAGNEQAVHIRLAVTKPGKVEIKVYTLGGTFVKELVNTRFDSGVYGLPGSVYPISWDATNMYGHLVASGVYLITVDMPDHQEFQKVAVIK